MLCQVRLLRLFGLVLSLLQILGTCDEIGWFRACSGQKQAREVDFADRASLTKDPSGLLLAVHLRLCSTTSITEDCGGLLPSVHLHLCSTANLTDDPSGEPPFGARPPASVILIITKRIQSGLTRGDSVRFFPFENHVFLFFWRLQLFESSLVSHNLGIWRFILFDTLEKISYPFSFMFY